MARADRLRFAVAVEPAVTLTAQLFGPYIAGVRLIVVGEASRNRLLATISVYPSFLW